ncbi:MAG: long-chain fatty acid--CoA ligase [Syntrophomonadaceae bacterium]|nr:long-chain fatty acid--CoA ligase [Syntrophomonadaceae bacterium]
MAMMDHYIKGLTMAGVFYNTVDSFPDHLAQVFAEELYDGDSNGQLTWSELRERVELLACGLIELGLQKGERAALMSSNSPYWTATELAVCCMGSVLVTIYPSLLLNEVEYIVTDSDSKYLLVGSEKVLKRVLPGMDAMPGIRKIIMLRMEYESDDPRVMSLKELIQLGRDTAEKNMPVYHQLRESLTLDDWASILYTSGTTGRGKGAVLAHGTFTSRVDGVAEVFVPGGNPVDENDRVLSLLPLSHIFERVAAEWVAIAAGSCIAYGESPSTIVADLARFNPTWFCCVPRIYEKVFVQLNAAMSSSAIKKRLFAWALATGDKVLEYRKDERGLYDLTQEFDVRSRLPFLLKLQFNLADKLFAKIRPLFGSNYSFSISAGTGISPKLLRFFNSMGIPVLEGYGLTETTSALSLGVKNASKFGSPGPPGFGAQWRLADDGEIEVTGAGIFLQYLNQPEETEKAFTEDGWFKTGDIGIVDENGYYSIIDRKKAIICTKTGKNIAPAKIEYLYGTSKYIEQIFLVGDERDFIAALIVPNFNYFIEFYEHRGIEYDKAALQYVEANGQQICSTVGDDFINHSSLRKRIAKEVEHNNHKLESHERIREYEILKTRFSEENGQLTPTQKVKKRVIIQEYADVIEGIYAQTEIEL